MNKQLLKAIEKRCVYHRSPETKVSFYRQLGSSDALPIRVNFSTDPEGFQRIARTGRAIINKKVADFKARFTRKDNPSPYRIDNGHTEQRVSFSLWECSPYPLIYGFADVGRTNENGKMEQTPDLVVVVRTLDNCLDSLDIRIYPGLYSQREEVLNLLYAELKAHPLIMV
ncbi:hypothetical protein A6C57_18615 [Fibrella sp. ES10-3-2-2]|nr:hypothetical protein A6C57_18615 [Fibrella sp. ES10-3-2-2]